MKAENDRPATAGAKWKLAVLICASLASGVVAPAASAQSSQAIVMSCKYMGLVWNMTLDPGNGSLRRETFTPNPGGSPDPRVWHDNLTNLAIQVTDQSISWSEADGSEPPFVFVLDRYTGSLRQTKKAGGAYPNGWDRTWQCEKKQRQF